MELRPFRWCSLWVSFCTWHSCSSWLFKQYSTSRRKKPSRLFSPTTSAKPKKKEATLSQKSTGLLAWSSVLPGAIPSPRYPNRQTVMETFRTTHPLIPCWFKWLMSLKVSQSMGVTLKLWLRWVWCLTALMLCVQCPEPHGCAEPGALWHHHGWRSMHGVGELNHPGYALLGHKELVEQNLRLGWGVCWQFFYFLILVLKKRCWTGSPVPFTPIHSFTGTDF